MVCTLNNSLFGITRVVFRGISKFGIIYVEILLKIVERIYLIIYNTWKIKFKNGLCKIVNNTIHDLLKWKNWEFLFCKK